MSKATTRTSESPVITVSDLIGELCRWPDNAVVTFRCPLHGQRLRFNRIEEPAKGAVEIELEPAVESTGAGTRMSA